MVIQRISVIWLLLVGFTVLTWSLGSATLTAGWIQAIVTGTVALKGYWIIYDFMHLRRVHVRWRVLVLGWLLLVMCLIALAFRLGV